MQVEQFKELQNPTLQLKLQCLYTNPDNRELLDEARSPGLIRRLRGTSKDQGRYTRPIGTEETRQVANMI